MKASSFIRPELPGFYEVVSDCQANSLKRSAVSTQLLAYSGLQMYASYVWAVLVIAYTLRAKTSFAPTENRSHASENRYK